MFPAMMTSLALPDRKVFKVDLYPNTTIVLHSLALGPSHIALLSDDECWIAVPLPLFMTSANRELMLSVAFLAFFCVGAMISRN